jgi:branched-chain amino acid transport system ATP-binding protein
MLAVSDLTVRYGSIAAARQVSLDVEAGTIVALIGPNGAGKTTTLGAIGGLLAPAGGSIAFDGFDVTGTAPDAMLRHGLALVPEHRRLFRDLTVHDNLRLGGITVSATERAELVDQMVDRFPVLARKLVTRAGFLSGGEAQQLAIARALMSRPKMILMDEPSLGLAPAIVDQVFDLVDELRSAGTTLLIVEQNVTRMLEVADRAYVMRSGEVVHHGDAADLRSDAGLFGTFVGGPRS